MSENWNETICLKKLSKLRSRLLELFCKKDVLWYSFSVKLKGLHRYLERTSFLVSFTKFKVFSEQLFYRKLENGGGSFKLQCLLNFLFRLFRILYHELELRVAIVSYWFLLFDVSTTMLWIQNSWWSSFKILIHSILTQDGRFWFIWSSVPIALVNLHYSTAWQKNFLNRQILVRTLSNIYGRFLIK